MFYSNYIKTNNIEYTVVNDTDLLIKFCYTKEDIIDFRIKNKELFGKQYELIFDHYIVYYGNIEDKNLFPIDNFPLSLIYYHNIYMYIKNIDKNIKLDVINNQKKIYELDEKKEYLFNWPMQECIICKDKTKDLHTNPELNILKIIYGIVGVNYFANCADYKIIENNTKKIINYREIKDDAIFSNSQTGYIWKATILPTQTQFNYIKIQLNHDDINNFSYYYMNSVLSYAMKEHINMNVMINLTNKCVNVSNNTFEHLVLCDGNYNIKFICDDNNIESVIYQIATNNNYIECDLNYYDNKFNSDILICNNMFDSKLIIKTKNNNPIKINYDLVMMEISLKKYVGLQQVNIIEL